MPRNPYQYTGMSGYSGPGYGQNFYYGQGRGSSPYGRESSRSTRNNMYMNPYQNYTSGGQSTYYPGSWKPDPYIPGGSLRNSGGYYPNNRMPQPPAGKGRGMGGIRMGGTSRFTPAQSNRSMVQDPWRGNDPFRIYGDLIMQRQMEEQLGLDPGMAWSMPSGFTPYELQNTPYLQGLYPTGGF